jgi:hypothetical protein
MFTWPLVKISNVLYMPSRPNYSENPSPVVVWIRVLLNENYRGNYDLRRFPEITRLRSQDLTYLKKS